MTMDHGKELPPLTLSNTSVSCLVTLIPVLVSMTSHGEIPSYEDETDKPVWWPSDIQWRNPKFYVQDADKKDDVLKVLRKLVYSCYSYHGVEDLLCRLEETPVSESETESGENMEIIQLAEDCEEDALEDSSAESEGPVFVCCFCLDQFSSHEHVNVHQSACSKRYRDTNPGSHSPMFINKTKSDSATAAKDYPSESLPSPVDCPTSPRDNASEEYLNMVTGSATSFSHIPSTKACFSSSNNQHSRDSPISASLSTPATSSSHKRPATATSVPCVPTLKTRSQKKLDQIMEKHNSRRLMVQECHQMKDVPQTGAWWVRKKRRKCNAEAQHPNSYCSKDVFALAVGLAQATDVAAMTKKGPKHEQEVDLDCEIISVEGPLSGVSLPLPPKDVEKPASASPRSTRSLMSQLSRDNEVNTRRKLSFCFVEDEWADKQALNEGRDPLQVSLLTLEISSPLGQRVKKYVRGEGHLNIIKDVESYCKTELDEDGYSKLRYRGCDFRVTFRKKRRASHHVHKYKFNKSDRLEFKTLLKTGLSAYSRLMRKGLPPCQVLLNRLSESEIKMWTEEKKITISEQIIFDDDICITQIDIPESRMTQGFTPDAHSLSQHQLYKQSHNLAPSSPVSVGRISMQSDNRSMFSPRMSASPPHVPNIFRSRTSHMSSPPRPCNISRTHNPSPGWRPPQLTNQATKNNGQHECSRLNSSIHTGNSFQRKQFEMSSHHLAHLSGHACLSPSAYVSEGSESKSNGDISGAINRRKQQLTHVRKDEGEASGSHTAVSNNRNLVSAGHIPCNLIGLGLMENHRGGTMQKAYGPHPSSSSGQALRSSTRKLSNFDYFSIRDGKMQPDYTHLNDVVVSQHRTYTSSSPAAHPHIHRNPGLSRQNYHHSGHTHHYRPSSSASSNSHHHHHHHYSSTSQPATTQARPSAIHGFNPSQQHRPTQSSNGKVDGASYSINHHGDNATRPQPLKKANPRTPTLKQLHRNTFSEDDDVMEIICIDDD